MYQQNLLLDPPASRRTDPVTSHQAEYELTASGKRAARRDYLRMLVSLHPGCTARELAKWAKETKGVPVALHSYYECMRRLNDLCDDTIGLVNILRPVYKGKKRKCSVSGLEVTTWWAK